MKFIFYLLPLAWLFIYVSGFKAFQVTTGLYDWLDYSQYVTSSVWEILSFVNDLPMMHGAKQWFITNITGNHNVLSFVYDYFMYILLVNLISVVFDLFNFIILWGERFFNYEENKMH